MPATPLPIVPSPEPGWAAPLSDALSPNESTTGTLPGPVSGRADLVFEMDSRYWIVDYKTHWLGEAREHYAPDRLEEVVAREGYALQYLIYLVALHRYLRRRLVAYDYEHHVGGAYYLFLRGLRCDVGPGASEPNGIFFDRPSRELIESLDRLLGLSADHPGLPAS